MASPYDTLFGGQMSPDLIQRALIGGGAPNPRAMFMANQAVPGAVPPQAQMSQNVQNYASQQGAMTKPDRNKPQNLQGMNPGLKEFLLRMGVPLGAAIGGTIFPGALPEMAGLATGYNTGFERQEDMMTKIDDEYKDVLEYDDESGRYKKIQSVKKGSELKPGKKMSNKEVLTEARLTTNAIISGSPEVAMQAMKDPTYFNTLLDKQIDMIRQREGSAAKQSLEGTDGGGNSEVIVEKDGQEYALPKRQLEEAMRQGYKRVGSP